MGRELFDFSFKEYANRWKFKRPMPADFFRTMEDASGVDLDWFWRGWFYTTDHVDIAIDGVDLYLPISVTQKPQRNKEKKTKKNNAQAFPNNGIRNSKNALTSIQASRISTTVMIPTKSQRSPKGV